MKNCYRNMQVFFMIGIFLVRQTSSEGLSVMYEWSQLEYEYQNDRKREDDINTKTFIPGRPIPLDVDAYYGSSHPKIFVTVPRITLGVPATLSTVTARKLNGNPLLRPYPSWSWHKNSTKSCGYNRIVSVFRVRVDECGRLWVLDSGLFGNRVSCRPQLLAFDLGTDKLVHKYEIPSKQLKFWSILSSLTVDVRDKMCTNTFVYVADTQTCSLIVYDVHNRKSWKITNKTFCRRLDYMVYKILGDTIFTPDGVAGIDLEPFNPGKDRKLFYHALASPTENWVYTSHIRNKSRFEENTSSSPEIFHTYPGERFAQSASEAIDSRGIAYFGLLPNVTMNCWNTNTEYGTKNIDTIDSNKTILQFPSGVKIIKDKSGVEELWVLTNRFQKFLTGKLSSGEINFRILYAKTEDILEGTKCAINNEGNKC